jgi:G6PDH family F420-dependent oxidoreductase
MKIGYFLSCEEYTPAQLLEQARKAEAAGFSALWISDHYHPWIDEQGQSPFVWSMIGALAQVTKLPITTGVTCPTVRIHPAVIAQAAATSQVLCEGRFRLGVGSGEALNEHILGDKWPEADERLEMLEEAVEIIRALFTGEQVSHDGMHYRVENARIYTLPETPPEILVSGFGPKATDLAARIGDGYCTTSPDELIQRFREGGGGDKTVQAGTKVCYAATKEAAVETVHRIWPNEALPGELAQVLPTPAHFEQATQLVTPEVIADSPTPTGPDLDEHREMIQGYADAGVDELYIQQIGSEHDDFFRVYADEVLPRWRAS